MDTIKDEIKETTLIQMDEGKARRVVVLLAASVGLMMTGYGLIMPIMARRVQELGSGVDSLGYMTMAFAVGQFLLSPFMGTLADRFGRKPLILVALGGIVLMNLAFLVAHSIELYIGIRFFEGAVSAGLLPASMGVIGDIFPESKRGQWVGILMGSYGFGFIFGPTLGGLLYDNLGFVAPFAVSAALAFIALIFGLIMLPETRPAAVRQLAKRERIARAKRGESVKTLPRPLYLLATLLVLDFAAVFTFAFIEPEMSFYFYNDLKFSTTQFGLIVGAYGLALVIGQGTLGRFSDRYGRKLMIVIGFIINAAFYLGLALVHDFFLILLVAIIAGLGASIVAPALSSFYLDIASEEHRSRVMGMKESAAALGGIAGPLLVAIVSGWLTPAVVFAISGVFTITLGIGALLVLKKPQKPEEVEITPMAVAEEIAAA